MEILLWLLVVVLVVAGIAGVIFPALPGTPMVFGGLLLAAWIGHFEKVGWATLTILGLLTVLSIGVDIFATALGAKRVGASGKAIAGATVGAVVGIFFGIPGLFLGPFIGAAVGEFLAHPDWVKAGKVGIGTWVGLLLGVAMKLALVITMLGVFATGWFL